ncbi:hypothetical protein [Sphingobacterium athyrii]|nr:hypothetical protein [Sphingobacterium athyrii]
MPNAVSGKVLIESGSIGVWGAESWIRASIEALDGCGLQGINS